MMNIGDQIKAADWRQGCLFRRADLQAMYGVPLSDNEFAIVLSQSCDLVHHSLDSEPTIEIVIATAIYECAGQYTFAKHSRRLHIEISAVDGATRPVEIVPHARHFLPREPLAVLTPDPGLFLLDEARSVLTNWLAGRYTRAALPDEFNRRINIANNKKAKKAASRLSKHVSGLYVDIHPFDEIAADDHYTVNLLALVPQRYADERHAIETSAEAIAELMRDHNMDVTVAVRSENNVPVSLMRAFQQLDFDALSLKSDPPDPLPPARPA